MKSILALIALTLVLAACGDSGRTADIPVGPGTTAASPPATVQSTSPSGELQGLGLDAVAAGLVNPVLVTAPAGDLRLFIVEQPGRIRIVAGGALLDEPFLDITDLVGSGSLEQGLVGLAFHPDFIENRRFFVYYTDVNGDSTVQGYRVGEDPNRADPATAVLTLTVDQPAGNHNGGMIAFGPDGYLYVALGDGGGANDQFGNGQNTGTLLGSMVRLDVDSNSPYAIPPDNPFATAGGEREIWAIGLRNPWRFSFDVPTGLVYVADVGQAEFEEINIVEAGAAGLNYGWSILEGEECFATRTCDAADTTLPVVVYDHTEGCSIIGGYVYRGAAIPELTGHYFYGDWCGGWVRSFRYDGGEVVDARDWSDSFGPIGRVLSFGQDGFGELYVTTGEGAVFKIAPRR